MAVFATVMAANWPVRRTYARPYVSNGRKYAPSTDEEEGNFLSAEASVEASSSMPPDTPRNENEDKPDDKKTKKQRRIECEVCVQDDFDRTLCGIC